MRQQLRNFGLILEFEEPMDDLEPACHIGVGGEFRNKLVQNLQRLTPQSEPPQPAILGEKRQRRIHRKTPSDVF